MSGLIHAATAQLKSQQAGVTSSAPIVPTALADSAPVETVAGHYGNIAHLFADPTKYTTIASDLASKAELGPNGGRVNVHKIVTATGSATTKLRRTFGI